MDDKGLMVSFSFVCHGDNVSRVKNLLTDLGMTSMYASGSEIHGVCEMSELQSIMQVLAKNKIAGFNSDTQIFTKPYSSGKTGRAN
jgi:hypothetical protein